MVKNNSIVEYTLQNFELHWVHQKQICSVYSIKYHKK